MESFKSGAGGMKIGIIVSGGGHLDEALQVIGAFEGRDVFLVTYSQKSLLTYRNAGIKRVHFVKLLGSSGFLLILGFFSHLFEFISIFLKEKPDVLFSTGSEITVIPFYLGKIFFRTKLVFLETVTRVSRPSFTARVVYPVCDLFLVQWEKMLESFGSKAKFCGRVI